MAQTDHEGPGYTLLPTLSVASDPTRAVPNRSRFGLSLSTLGSVPGLSVPEFPSPSLGTSSGGVGTGT